MRVGNLLRRAVLAGFLTFMLVPLPGAGAAPSPAGAAAGATEPAPAHAAPLTSRLLAEPLVPTGPSSPAEQAALRAALARFDAAGDPLDRGVLDAFLERYPDSVWTSALRGNLGLAAAHAGRYTQALRDWQAAWDAGQSAAARPAQAFADRLLGERLHLLTRLGHQDAVAALLADTDDRPLAGSASEARTFAREGLWRMRHQPETAFLCGPRALDQLQPAPDEGVPATAPPAAPGGHTLAALHALARARGLDLTPVHRRDGQAIPVPAIIHWQSGHYAALVAADGDRYLVRDPVMPQETWLPRASLDAEGSGYYLAPAPQVAAAGWRVLAADEAGRIRGAGNTGTIIPTETPPCDASTACACDGGDGDGAGGGDGGPFGSMPPAAMLTARAQSLAVSLALSDTPLAYAPSRGPAVPLTLTYSQREAYQPAAFTYFNVGPKWTLASLSYIVDDPRSAGSGVQRYNAGGGTTLYAGYDAATGQFAPTARDMAVLVRTAAEPVAYERRLGDGSTEIYAHSDRQAAYPRRVFLSRIVDPAGNALSFTYDARLRLTALRDADGRSTTFQYTHADPLRVTGITDPFGRQATIAYDSLGRLVSITDVLGFTSSVTYTGGGHFIDSLTTPYGTSRFAYGENGVRRWLELTDPHGATERVEFLNGAAGIPFSETQVPAGIDAFNAYINGRNTFYWDKTAHARAPGDYTQARIKHWYHDRTDGNAAVGVLESIKQPLESRVWFNYPGQGWAGANGTCDRPSAIARVLPDGRTQLTRMTYNAQGQLLTRVDPKGRRTTYTYADNGIDLVKATRATAAGEDVLLEMTWNAQHRPLTFTDAAGQVTRFTYNAAGQTLTQTNPLGETTTYRYDADGRLQTVLDAQGRTQRRYAYDDHGRLAAETDSEGYALAYAYDALNRRIRTTYPDGTTRAHTWDRFDLAATRDRNGRTTRYTHDATRRLTAVTDPLERTVQYGYQENGRLASLTDAQGNVTRWERDLQGRVTAKVYPDGARDTQAYDSAGRLAERTDALGQTERRRYGLDDRLTGIDYLNPQQPTPAVQVQDDEAYPRLAALTDGLGTTRYAYVPAGTPGAGQVQAVDGPYDNDVVAYVYDALGRPTQRTIGDAAETFAYDALGRLTAHATPLGRFSYAYLGQTPQVQRQQLAGGFVIERMYEGNAGDRRLKVILPWSLASLPGTNAAVHVYENRPEQLIAAHGTLPGRAVRYAYDAADRLVREERLPWFLDWKTWIPGLAEAGAPLATLLGEHGRTPPNLPNQPNVPSSRRTTAYTLDAADNLTRVEGPDAGWSGTVNANNQYVTALGALWHYDAAGRLRDDGRRTYAWDAAHRLVRVADTASGRISEFAYDGLSRLTVRREYAHAGAAPVETRYLWCGDRVCQRRDGRDVPVGRHFDEGELQGSTALYYVKDHLGSVADVVTSQGRRLGTLDYTPYGDTAAASGTLPDHRYAGMLAHPETGLYFTYFRVYDPLTGRWLSRDPSGEEGGLNLYAYVEGNPISRIDPDGLQTLPLPVPEPLNGIPGNPLKPKPSDDPLGPYGLSERPKQPYPWDDTIPTVKQPDPLPPVPPGGADACYDLYRNCLGGTNICPPGIRQGARSLCFALYVVCAMSNGTGVGG